MVSGSRKQSPLARIDLQSATIAEASINAAGEPRKLDAAQSLLFVEADKGDGPAYQTCIESAVLSKAFPEMFRRRN
jgi:hypothetical protein